MSVFVGSIILHLGRYEIYFFTVALVIIICPVLRWMSGNVVVETDAAENIKATNAKSPEKIDDIVTAIMALDRAVRNQGDQGSVYDSRGIVIL